MIEAHPNCEYDSVLIYDGETRSDPLIGSYCGDVAPPIIKSSSNHLLVALVSDFSVAKDGFSASYRTTLGKVTVDCCGSK